MQMGQGTIDYKWNGTGVLVLYCDVPGSPHRGLEPWWFYGDHRPAGMQQYIREAWVTYDLVHFPMEGRSGHQIKGTSIIFGNQRND